MNIIEELGGYESAKKKLAEIQEANKRHKESKMCGFSFAENYLADLRNALLEYRRTHNVYEVGDLVVIKKKTAKSKLWKIVGESNVFEDNFVCDADGELLHHFHRGEIQHATPQEIKAGK